MSKVCDCMGIFNRHEAGSRYGCTEGLTYYERLDRIERKYEQGPYARIRPTSAAVMRPGSRKPKRRAEK